MRKVFASVFLAFFALCLCSCGEPPYTGPAGYYDERVQEDVGYACSYLEDANWDLDAVSDYIEKAVEQGTITEEDAAALLNYLNIVRQDVQKSGEYLGYW